MDDNCVYFTRDEVVIHNSQDDIWVIVHKLVYNLTEFLQKRRDTMNDNLRLLIQFAGKDLSWSFSDHGEPLERIDQHIQSVPVFPPVYEKESNESDFWWKDSNNIIGKVTSVERRIRVVNTLTRKPIFMNVCEEYSIQTIQQKYAKRFNRDAEKYIWRKKCSQENPAHLFMAKTMTQNGILFEENEKLGLPAAFWIYFV